MSKQTKNYIGQSQKMNNGMIATCIVYRSYMDIDVRFEDGTVVCNKTINAFNNGTIANPNYDPFNCCGETRRMNNGMNATCIAYRKAVDIDVEFEDGYIVRGTRKKEFYDGKIANKNIGKNYTAQKSILGMTLRMNNGMNATCIAYRGSRDIDVEFEDGFIAKNKQKIHFLTGNIRNDNWLPKSFPQRIVYECIHIYFPDTIYNFRPPFMKNVKTGANLEIDIWIPSKKVAVEYDGYPWHSKDDPSSIEKAEIFEKSEEVDTIYTFLEKGTVTHHGKKHKNIFLSYTSSKDISFYSEELELKIIQLLKNIGIKSPDISINSEFLDKIRAKFKNDLLGKTMKMNCGMDATCIAYRRIDNIDIQFEDGTIVQNKSKTSFILGQIANPSLGRGYSKIKDYCGQSKTMNNGETAMIIKSNGSSSVDIQFEDGTIVKNISIKRFNSGSIANPSKGKGYTKHLKQSILGNSFKMNCGMSAICIADRNAYDVDIQFEDGEIVQHTSRAAVKFGSVAHPILGKYYVQTQKSSILNSSRKMQNGIVAKCIAYRNNRDIDVEFEDGVIVCNKTKNSFLTGKIAHPNKSRQLSKINHSSCIGETLIMNNGMKATCIAYRGCSDIDIQFEDGTIVYHKQKDKFKKGIIGYPNK